MLHNEYIYNTISLHNSIIMHRYNNNHIELRFKIRYIMIIYKINYISVTYILYLDLETAIWIRYRKLDIKSK